MIGQGRHLVLGVGVDALDEEAAAAAVLEAARARRPFAGTALAVHGVMTAMHDRQFAGYVAGLDLVAADGQPVRWALNLLHRSGLTERVYGPALAERLLAAAAHEGLAVYFYGSTAPIVEALTRRSAQRHPRLRIAGSAASQFRKVTPGELDEIAAAIAGSGARVVFVGTGCPRQEVLAHHLRARLDIPVLAIGAGFEYLAGIRRQPPAIVQRAGLQWLWRLVAEPRRLWRRYVLLNPQFVALLTLQATGLWRPRPVPAAAGEADAIWA